VFGAAIDNEMRSLIKENNELKCELNEANDPENWNKRRRISQRIKS
jgi:hypothetical protein